MEPKLNRIDQEIENRQIARLRDLKNSRDRAKVEKALSQLQKAAEKEENLMPHIINAIKNYSTLGEFSGTLRTVFGTYEPNIAF